MQGYEFRHDVWGKFYWLEQQEHSDQGHAAQLRLSKSFMWQETKMYACIMQYLRPARGKRI